MELVFAPIAELRAQLTHAFEEIVGTTLDANIGASPESHRFACGLTGGSTALIFLGSLREAAVEWSHVRLYWGDERAVPPDHPSSNYGLAERLLLSPLGARAPFAQRMPAEEPDLTRAARQYDAVLPPALDLLILGVGDDGHICSLFPGHPALREGTAKALAIEDSPKPPPRRMTLSLPYVLASRHIWIVAIGPRKLPILRRAVSKADVTTPFELVVANHGSVTVFTDQAIRTEVQNGGSNQGSHRGSSSGVRR